MSPCTGSLQPGSQQVVTVNCAAEQLGNWNQGLLIDISDLDPSDQPDGIPYRLLAEVCKPGESWMILLCVAWLINHTKVAALFHSSSIHIICVDYTEITKMGKTVLTAVFIFMSVFKPILSRSGLPKVVSVGQSWLAIRFLSFRGSQVKCWNDLSPSSSASLLTNTSSSLLLWFSRHCVRHVFHLWGVPYVPQ